MTAAIGLYLGVWASIFPYRFFTSFPGAGLHWIELMGPYDEHLVRDVGFMYLAMAAMMIAAMFTRTAVAGRLAGLGWTINSGLHFIFHMTHLKGSAVDIVGHVVSLSFSLVLGIVLLFPSRVPAPKEPGT